MIHRQHAFCRICKPINDFEGIRIHVFHFYVKPNKYSIDFDQERMAIEKQVIYIVVQERPYHLITGPKSKFSDLRIFTRSVRLYKKLDLKGFRIELYICI